MNQDNDQDNLNIDDNAKGKLPQALNVLTILTFIGCGLIGLVTLCSPLIYSFTLEYLNKQLTSGRDFTAREITKLEQGKAAMELAQEHMIPLMVIGLIGVALCLVGAIWMRKLKKDGFWLYVAGQVVPIIGSTIIIGTDQYRSTGSLVGLLIPVVFIVLYAFQRKYLVK